LAGKDALTFLNIQNLLQWEIVEVQARRLCHEKIERIRTHESVLKGLGDQSGVRYLPFWLLCLVVGLAPLPFGSDRDWASATLALAIASISLLWLIATIFRLSPHMVALTRYALPASMFLLLLLWFALQIATFTPEALHHPIWKQATQALGVPYEGSIALDPEGATSTLIRMLTYVLVFFVAMQYGREASICSNGLWVVVIAATVFATYGLFEQLSGSHSILGLRKLYSREYLTSTFENRDSAAAYFGIGIVCCVGLISAEWIRVIGNGVSLRHKLRQVSENAEMSLLALAVSLILCAGALAWTGSCNGVFFTFIGVATTLLATFVVRKQRHWIAPFTIPALVLIAYVVFGLGGESLFGRFHSCTSPEIRFRYFEVAYDAVQARPWLGYGLGSFQVVFEAFRAGQFDFDMPAIERAHNVLLELIVAGGIGVTVPMLVIIGSLGWVLFRGLRCCNRHYAFPASGLGIGALVVLHGTFNASTQTPAIAMTYWFVFGLTYGTALLHREQHRRVGLTSNLPHDLRVEAD
jgi:O-antigen ligase